jgi:GTP-binding protein
LLVATKIDAANKDKLAKLKHYAKKKKFELFSISAVTGKGIEELKFAMAAKVDEVKAAISAATASVEEEL